MELRYLHALNDLLFKNNIEQARAYCLDNKQHVTTEVLSIACHIFAGENNIEAVKMLVGLGAAINHIRHPNIEKVGVILTASECGHINIVNWLLEQGAIINHLEDGRELCSPLSLACMDGHLEVVKLLVAHGAAYKGISGAKGKYFAKQRGHTELVDYLESIGAGTVIEMPVYTYPPREKQPVPDADKLHQIQLDFEEPYFKQTLSFILMKFGFPEDECYQAVHPLDPDIKVLIFKKEDCNIIMTHGMSRQPMQVPAGAESFKYAEMYMFLPKDWPLDLQSWEDEDHFWPIDWLRRTAFIPFQNETWIGGETADFMHEHPPKPFAAGTNQCGLFAVNHPKDVFERHDGETLRFYQLFPIYREEYDLLEDHGPQCLLQAFAKQDINMVVDPKRKNACQ